MIETHEEVILAVLRDPATGRFAVVRDGLILGRYSSYPRALEALEVDQGEPEGQILADVPNVAQEDPQEVAA